MKNIAKIISLIITYTILFSYGVFADSLDLQQELDDQINKKLVELNGDFFNEFDKKILKENNYFLEDGVWYTYSYDKYLSTGIGEIPNKQDLIDEGIDFKNDILLLDDSFGVGVIVDYNKVKLIKDDIIGVITNKNQFLKDLVYEKGYFQNDTDDLFLELKNKTIELTEGLNNGNKILAIYDYILQNTEYSKKFDVSKKEIFSGIYTYKNGNGVCSGYSKLFLYMLSFAGIEDVEEKKGNVIEIDNFTDYGHAWVRIGDKYFDPTFDDPIGNTKTLEFSEYRYFGLPYDLFYTNRFDYGTMPKYLEKTDLDYRKNIVKQNLEDLHIKYKNSNYNLLKNINSELTFINYIK